MRASEGGGRAIAIPFPPSTSSSSHSTPASPSSPVPPGLMEQIHEARMLLKAGQTEKAKQLLHACVSESTKRTRCGDASDTTRMAHGHALHNLGMIYAATEGQHDQAAYCYLLASNSWPPLAPIAMENFQLVYAKSSNSSANHLCSLLNDEQRHAHIISALEVALAQAPEKETEEGEPNPSAPILVAGPSSVLLAILITKTLGRPVTVVEDSRVSTLLGKASVEASGVSKSISFIDAPTISRILDEDFPSPFAGFAFDPFPYTFDVKPLQLLSSVLRHHQKYHGSSSQPAIVPNHLVLKAFIVESLAIRQLAQVAPTDRGVVQGFNLGFVMDALGRCAVPIDSGLFPFKILSGPEPLSIQLPVEELSGLGLGRSVIHQWDFNAGSDGRVDAILYWIDAKVETNPAGEKEDEVIISCDPRAVDGQRSSTRVEAAGAMHEKGERLSTIRDLRQSHLWQTVWLDFESFQVKEGDSLRIELCLTAQQSPGVGGPSFQWLSPTTTSMVDESLGFAPILDYHLPMVNDISRNAAYEAAIIQAIKRKQEEGKESIRVLDLGAGSGLLGMMAARAGAEEVVCLEKVEVLAGAANLIVEDNGFAEKIVVINELSTDLLEEHLGGRFDILVSETFGDQPLSESVLSSFAHAHAELLFPDAVVIPSKLRIIGVLAHIQGLETYCQFPSTMSSNSVKMGAWNCVLPSQISLHLRSYPHQILCEPVCLGEVDLRAASIDLQGRFEAMVTISPKSSVTGEVEGQESFSNAIVVWFELDMLAQNIDDSHQAKEEGEKEDASTPHPIVSTAPDQGLRPHWKQAVYFIPPASKCSTLKPGDHVQLVTVYQKDRLKVQVKPFSRAGEEGF